jgi:hypothetical protein
MRRGSLPHAAGRTTPGITPLPVRTVPPHFYLRTPRNRAALYVQAGQRSDLTGQLLTFLCRRTISNRHLRRLECDVTSTKQTTEVQSNRQKIAHVAISDHTLRKIACRAGCLPANPSAQLCRPRSRTTTRTTKSASAFNLYLPPAIRLARHPGHGPQTACAPGYSTHGPEISNRHSMRLEIAATHSKQTPDSFLIGTENGPHRPKIQHGSLFKFRESVSENVKGNAGIARRSEGREPNAAVKRLSTESYNEGLALVVDGKVHCTGRPRNLGDVRGVIEEAKSRRVEVLRWAR